MNRVEEKKITVHEKAIVEILDSTQKLNANKALMASIFQSAGIIIDDRLSLVSLTGNPETCLNSLMNKLSALSIIRMSAKRILWNRGLNGGGLVPYLSCSDFPPKRRTSWFARRTG